MRRWDVNKIIGGKAQVADGQRGGDGLDGERNGWPNGQADERSNRQTQGEGDKKNESAYGNYDFSAFFDLHAHFVCTREYAMKIFECV